MLYKLAPSLIKDGHVYILNTPLFEIKDLKTQEIFYAFSDSEKDEILSRIEKPLINRNKGLGELEPETMANCIGADSKTKQRVKWEDAEEIAKWFDILMGDLAKERKEFVEQELPNYIEKSGGSY